MAEPLSKLEEALLAVPQQGKSQTKQVISKQDAEKIAVLTDIVLGKTGTPAQRTALTRIVHPFVEADYAASAGITCRKFVEILQQTRGLSSTDIGELPDF